MSTKPTVKAIIAPSLLSGDFAKFGEDAQKMINFGADWLHVDVMDGHFVPNLTIGPPVVQSLRKYLGADAFLDCHLMIESPEKWIQQFAKAGASSVTLHIETLPDPTPVLEECHKLGIKCGLSVKPKTPIETVFPYLDKLDVILIMTVEPGFGGQAFMPEMMLKVHALDTELRARDLRSRVHIEVDGGLNEVNVHEAAKQGANAIVAGSSIFGSKDPAATIQHMRAAVNAHF